MTVDAQAALLVEETHLYLLGRAHGAEHIPAMFPAYKAYRAGWFEGVETDA